MVGLLLPSKLPESGRTPFKRLRCIMKAVSWCMIESQRLPDGLRKVSTDSVSGCKFSDERTERVEGEIVD